MKQCATLLTLCLLLFFASANSQPSEFNKKQADSLNLLGEINDLTQFKSVLTSRVSKLDSIFQSNNRLIKAIEQKRHDMDTTLMEKRALVYLMEKSEDKDDQAKIASIKKELKDLEASIEQNDTKFASIKKRHAGTEEEIISTRQLIVEISQQLDDLKKRQL